MHRFVRRLLWVSTGYLLSAGIGTALAVRQGLPAEFAGFLHGKDVLSDFVLGLGTALSPPAFMLVIQVVLMVLVTRKDALGRIGAGGLAVLGVLYGFGQLGEPVLWRLFIPSWFDWLRLPILVANLLLPLLMVFYGLRVLRRLIRPEGVSPY